MTISETFVPYMSYCESERHVAPSTLAKYRDCFESWVRPFFGSKDVSALNRLMMLELRQAMVDRQLSIARQYSIMMFIKTFLKFCRSTLGISCLDPAEVNLPRRPAPEVVYLTNPELQKVFDSINVDTYAGMRLRALIEVLLATGMRISEALALKRAPFEDGVNELEIVGKAKRKRTVFFNHRCRMWVQHYLQKRVDENPYLFVTTGYPVRVFKREDVSRFFQNLKKRAGLSKKFTPHILRHTHCTLLRNNGADISIIKELAGHQDIQTTARYYLGKDKEVLRRTVATCLDYGLPRESSAPILPINDGLLPRTISANAT